MQGYNGPVPRNKDYKTGNSLARISDHFKANIDAQALAHYRQIRQTNYLDSTSLHNGKNPGKTRVIMNMQTPDTERWRPTHWVVLGLRMSDFEQVVLMNGVL